MHRIVLSVFTDCLALSILSSKLFVSYSLMFSVRNLRTSSPHRPRLIIGLKVRRNHLAYLDPWPTFGSQRLLGREQVRIW